MTLDTTHPESEESLRRLDELDHVELNTFKYTECKSQVIENDIDPKINFFLNNNDCHYYTDDQYYQYFQD